MVKSTKLKKKIFNKVIKKLGSTLTVTPYTKGVKDAFGKKTDIAGVSYDIISVESNEFKKFYSSIQDIKVIQGTISLFVDPNLSLDDTDTSYNKFTWFGKNYRYKSEDIIGGLQDINIVKIIYLRSDE